MSDDDQTKPIPREDDTRPIVDDEDTRPMPPAPAEPTGHIRVVSSTGPAAVASVPAPPPAPVAQRVGTVVWGLVVAAVGVGLLSVAWGANLDAELALIVLLGVAGAALLVGSLVGLRRSRVRKEGRA